MRPCPRRPAPTNLAAVGKGGHLSLAVQRGHAAVVALALRRQQLGHALPNAAGAALQREPAAAVQVWAVQAGGGSTTQYSGCRQKSRVTLPRAGGAATHHPKPAEGKRLWPRTCRPPTPTHLPQHPAAPPPRQQHPPEHRVGPPPSVLLVVDDVGDGAVNINRRHALAQPVALHHRRRHRPHLQAGAGRRGDGRAAAECVASEGGTRHTHTPITHTHTPVSTRQHPTLKL